MIVDLNLKGKRALLAGGGTEAVRKVAGLLTQDCEIIVVAENAAEEIRGWADAGKIQLHERRVKDGSFLKDYDPLYLVMAATDDKNLNREIVNAAKEMRCYVYAVDDPEASDFSQPALINLHDTVQVAISTGGRSPLMAKNIRTKAESVLRNLISQKDALHIQLQGRLRKQVQEKIEQPPNRKEFLENLLGDGEIGDLLSGGNLDEAENLALSKLKKYAAGIS